VSGSRRVPGQKIRKAPGMNPLRHGQKQKTGMQEEERSHEEPDVALDFDLIETLKNNPMGENMNNKDLKYLKDARDEFKDERSALGFWTASDEEVEKSFNSKPHGTEGKYIMNYFNFLRYVIASNLVMTIWCFIGWIPHVRNTRPMFEKEGLGSASTSVDLLFLSSYQPSSDKLWLAMAVLGTITMTFSGPVYMLFFIKKKDHDLHEDDNLTEKERDDIEAEMDKIQRPGSDGNGDSNSKTSRVILSYVVLVVLCFIPIGINFALLYVASNRSLKVFFRYHQLESPTTNLFASTCRTSIRA
jgi:hypothetical protein